MINLRSLGNVTQALGGVISKFSSERAVRDQVQQNGGAMNTAAQSSVQTAAEKAMKSRREALIGQTQNILVTAPEAPHLELHSEDQRHSPSDPRYRLRRQGGQGQQGKGGQKGRR